MIPNYPHLMQTGPNRVVINKEGEAVPYETAFLEWAISPDIIFIRNDGWTLGAPLYLAQVAYELWADQWENFLTWPEARLHSISQLYKHTNMQVGKHESIVDRDSGGAD